MIVFILASLGRVERDRTRPRSRAPARRRSFHWGRDESNASVQVELRKRLYMTDRQTSSNPKPGFE